MRGAEFIDIVFLLGIIKILLKNQCQKSIKQINAKLKSEEIKLLTSVTGLMSTSKRKQI